MIDAENMVRVGIVSSVDEANLKARVYFPDSGDMVSDWLYLVQQKKQYTMMDDDLEGGKHKHTDSIGGNTSEVSHKHELADWIPEVGDRALVLYPCGIDKDGYILGVIP